MECRLWVASEWIIHCARLIFQDLASEEELDEHAARSLRTGSLCDQIPPMSVERWDYWKKRFSELSTVLRKRMNKNQTHTPTRRPGGRGGGGGGGRGGGGGGAYLTSDSSIHASSTPYFPQPTNIQHSLPTSPVKNLSLSLKNLSCPIMSCHISIPSVLHLFALYPIISCLYPWSRISPWVLAMVWMMISVADSGGWAWMNEYGVMGDGNCCF